MEKPKTMLIFAILTVIIAASGRLPAQAIHRSKTVDSTRFASVIIRFEASNDGFVVLTAQRGAKDIFAATEDARDIAALADSMALAAGAQIQHVAGERASADASWDLISFVREVTDRGDSMALTLGTVPAIKLSAAEVSAFVAALRHAATETATMSATSPPVRSSTSLDTTLSDEVYFDFQVERQAVAAKNNPSPRYPDMLRSANVEGEVLAQFIVDTLGRADMGTFKVLKSTHDLFTNAVKAALPNMKFYPAEVGGKKVKQLVQMSFPFTP